MNGKRTLILLIIVGLFAAALVSRKAALAWMCLPFLGYAGAGLLTAPRSPSLRAVRSASQSRIEAEMPVVMKVRVENSGQIVPLLRIVEPAMDALRVVEGNLVRAGPLPPGASVEIQYSFAAPRGWYRWESVTTAASDPFGLFETLIDLPAPADVRVLPAKLPLKRLRLRPRHTLRAAGPHLSRWPGPGVDFFGVREYHPGDSMRQVHWRMAARHPGHFYSKDFEREEMADIGLILDGSAAANLKCKNGELFEYSVAAAGALARTILRSGNRLSLLILGEKVVRVFPGAGKRQLTHVLAQLAGCRPGENTTLNTMKYLPVRLFPSHSQLVLISPLRGDDFTAIARLRASGYQILVVSPDPVAFASREPHHPLAVRAARLERAALLWRLREIGVRIIEWPVEQPLLKVIEPFVWRTV